MNQKPFKSLRFDWLFDTDQKSWHGNPDPSDAGEWVVGQFPVHPFMMESSYGELMLAHGLNLHFVRVQVRPEGLGQMLSVDVPVSFKAPTFQATSCAQGRSHMREQFPPAELVCAPGIGLFRHATQYHVTVSTDLSQDFSSVLLTVDDEMLIRLIGDAETTQLFAALQVVSLPSYVAWAVPAHIAGHLHKATLLPLKGAALRLAAQAKVLEYLSGLVTHFVQDEPPEVRSLGSAKRVKMVHEYLLSCEGKLPTLDDLSILFGRSAKLLNIEFAREFGSPIHTFMSDHRLEQAHAALLESPIPIKQLASALGYSHVSNFTIAFKRKFGYPPGSLRGMSQKGNLYA